MSDGPQRTNAPPTAPEASAAESVADTQAAPAASPPPVRSLGWRDVWQVPTLALAGCAIAIGLFYVSRLPRSHDFDGALNQVDALLAAGRLNEARTALFDGIKPYLDDASELEIGRFEATAADWLSAARSAGGGSAVENDRQIDERYAKAQSVGFEIDRDRTLRWAAALVHLGRTRDALDKVERLSEARGESGAEGSERESEDLRARVRRMVMERAWEDGTRHAIAPQWNGLLESLALFRTEPGISPEDDAWAAARQAEARLALEHPREAADRLLIDLRRLESAETVGQTSAPPDSFAELSYLLGTAYAAMGLDDSARESLERAVSLSAGNSLAKGGSLVLLGQLALQRGDLDEAEQRFESVLADYAGEPVYAPALFGRAETRAARGEHQDALKDYRAVEEMVSSGLAERINPSDVVGSLVDRHDALLVAGELEPAIEYSRTAAEWFRGRLVPPEIQLRIATTSRALADRMLASESKDQVDTRAHAGSLLRGAGDAFLSHANHPDAIRESADSWAESLWLAADCYERSGSTADAVRVFRLFIEARPVGDLRRAEAMFRIASMQHAEGDLAEASAGYERVLDEFPNSPLAARAAVPLARCLDATGRRAEAISRLQQVVEGRAGLTPEATEYREALLELGRIMVAAGDLGRGASLLEESLRRYPTDPRAIETRFQLGECRRGLAREAAARLADGALSPSQRKSLDESRIADLTKAKDDFEAVVRALDGRDPESLDPLERDAMRLGHLYRADCLFDLGRYREAVDLYEIAERRYSDSAVSMIALIQIVNAWHELGDADRAATAQRRAEIRLAQLPDQAFLASNSIFSRDAWERWLRNSPPVPRAVAAARGSESRLGSAESPNEEGAPE